MQWKLEENQPKHVHIRSLGTRISLPVVFVAFAALAIAGVTFFRLRQAVQQDVRASALTLARAVALGPARTVSVLNAALETLAADGSVQSKNWKACGSAAAAILAAHPEFADAGIAGLDGAVVCDGTGKTVGNAASAAWFRRALSTRDFAVGDYQLERGTGRPVIGFGLSVQGQNAAPAAIAFIILRVGAFGPARSVAASLPQDAGYGVLDGRGTLLARLPEEEQWFGQRLPEDALEREVMSSFDGVATLRGIDGVSRIYAYSRVAGTGPAPLAVYVGIPVAAAFAAERRALAATGAVGAAVAAFSLWLAFAMGDMLILRRIRRLNETMRRIVAGDLEGRKELLYGMGELDELTGVFDAITAKLEESYAGQEQKVKKRTVELEFNKGMAELEKARTEALLKSVGDGLFATDEVGKITFVNQQAERMLGYPADQIVGAVVYAFLRLENDKGEAVTAQQQPTRIAIRTKERYVSPVYPKPYYLVRKDKSRFPTQINVTPIIATGEVVGSIQVFRDITGEIEFDRRKSEFISIASHQLRSPLSATKWLSDMLRKGDVGALQPKQQELADKLFDANERMVTLVNEMLNVSRLESGTVKLAPAETDLAKLVDGMLIENTPLLESKKQKFDRLIVDVPKVNVDATLIREVIANLISNAGKYSPEGSTITVTLERQGGEVAFSVADQGIGIPQSDQEQMFKKFFRAGNAAKSVVVGTGLGLYVCKAIIELHGGRIGFTSELNKGTTFFFTLPVNSVPLASGEVHLT